MNPLLFADWGRMNRLFTRVMWLAAAVLVCIVCIAATGPRSTPHPATAPARSAGAANVGSAH